MAQAKRDLEKSIIHYNKGPKTPPPKPKILNSLKSACGPGKA
jgi:hypothetical protein